MASYFSKILEKLKDTLEKELEDLSYMEILTATSNKIDGHINEDAWDILQAIRKGELPKNAESENITKGDMLSSENTIILARTRIELDGDFAFLVRGNDDGQPLPINQDVIRLHEYGIENSIENWHFFLNYMIEVTKTVEGILGIKP
jgi:hypothetical protein